MKNIKLPLIFFLVFVTSFTSAQEIDVEFGEVSKSDLEMTVYAPDSSASAVVLYDYGHSYFQFNKSDYSLKLTFETHTRIKILKKDALKRGTFKIKLYNRLSRKEKIEKYKGYTFNIEDGKIEKSKLRSKNKFIQEIDERNNTINFTFPDVKVGSIIDFKYTKTSDFDYNLESWFFQRDIPVVWSEYKVDIPEYYHYYKNNKGYFPSHIYTENNESKTYRVTTKHRENWGGTTAKTRYSNDKISYFETKYRFVYKDIPAFKNESFIGSAIDYVSQVSFELQSVKFPNSPAKNYSDSYESISKKMLKSRRFGDQLNSFRFLKKEINEIKKTTNDPIEKMELAFLWVKDNIKWNEYNGLYTKESIKDVYKKKEGNAGGVNLLLTTLLRGLGLDANPVALSTRSNGKLSISHPSISSFNYAIAHVNIADKEYLLDATSYNLPINQLPARCLNDKGRLITNDGGKWITLNNNTEFFRSEMIKASVNEDGELVAKRKVINKKYAAFRKRESIDENGGVDKYFESFADDDIDFLFENYKVEKLEDINAPLVEKMDFSTQFSDGEDVVYFNPLFTFKVEENPFVQEERNYPVDFPYPTKEKFVLQLEIPNGYEVKELPKPISALLPNNAGKFKYQSIINSSFAPTSIN